MAFRPRSVAVKQKCAATSATAASASPSTSSAARSGAATFPSGQAQSSINQPGQAVAGDQVGAVATGSSSHAPVGQNGDDDKDMTSASQSMARVTIDHRRRQLDEQILAAVESSFSDWGLSVHSSSGLLEKLKSSSNGVHLQHVLNLPPVRALTSVQADIQRAIVSRQSPIVQLSENGFGVQRTTLVDFERLEQLEPADWDDMTLYLEDIPSVPASSAYSGSLVSLLSTLLATQVQRVILPPLYNRDRYEQEEEEGDGYSYDNHDDNDDRPTNQSEAFAKAQAGQSDKPRRRQGLKLPSGGGPFRGFAFVIVQSRADAERILAEWKWEREASVCRDEQDVNGGEDRMDDDAEEDAEEPAVETSKVDKSELDKLARVSGMRSLPYFQWLRLKSEYLRYRRDLNVLADAYAQRDRERRRRRMRRSPSPPPPDIARDDPPHLVDSLSSNGYPSGHNKRPLEAQESARKRAAKRTKRESSPSEWDRHVRPPTPDVDELDTSEALEARGAFPKGCIMWLRNVHEKSTKNSLKTVLSKVLEELEEGSGTGVQFVDYEKGLDNCHVRFASSHLASLVADHLSSNSCVQLASNYISSPGLSMSPPEGVTANDPTRRPLVAQLLEGERERLYWQQLPESTRRDARKSAGGPVALVNKGKKAIAREVIEAKLLADRAEGKTAREAVPDRGQDVQAPSSDQAAFGTDGTATERKTKKPSRV